MPQHAYVPFGVSEGSSSFDEHIRPSLHRAYPLPEDHGADRMFQRLLDAFAQRSAPGTRTDDLALCALDRPTGL